MYGTTSSFNQAQSKAHKPSPISDPSPEIDGPRGEIGQQALRLNGLVERLEHTVNSLGFALAPILRPAILSQAEAQERPASEMADFLFERNNHLELQISALQSFNARVDL